MKIMKKQFLMICTQVPAASGACLAALARLAETLRAMEAETDEKGRESRVVRRADV